MNTDQPSKSSSDTFNAAFFAAVQAGDDAALTAFLEQGIDVHQTNEQGLTALMVAAHYDHQQCLELLLDAGADPNQTGKSACTALIMAANQCQPKCLELLLTAGADPNQAMLKGQTVLMTAILSKYPKQVNNIYLQAYLKRKKTLQGIDLEFEENARKVLMKPALERYHQCIQLLLAAGSNPNQTTINGQTALMLAVQEQQQQAIKLLLAAGANPHLKTNNGVSALYCAERKNTLAIMPLLEAGAKPSHKNFPNSLVSLTLNGHSQYIKRFLTAGVAPNKSNSFGLYPLMTAAQFAHSDCLQLLLNNGANPNIINTLGTSAIMEAYRNASIQNIRLLLAAGADPNKEPGFYPPLGLLNVVKKEQHQSLKLLLAVGAQPNPKSSRIKSLLASAAEGGHLDICQTLLIWGASITDAEIAQLQFFPHRTTEQQNEIKALLNQQAELRHQFGLLGYSDFMSDLYSGRVSEDTLCQTLVSRDFNKYSHEYVTPEGVHILSASAILNKPDVLLTASLLAADGDLLLAADIIAKQKQILPACHHACVNDVQNILKLAQQLLHQHQSLAAPTAATTDTPLLFKLLQYQILTHLLRQLKDSTSPWFEVLIDKIIQRAAIHHHQRHQVRTNCPTAFTELAATHPLLLTLQPNLYQRLSLQADSINPHQAAIFNDQILSSLPAHVLWQRALSEVEAEQKFTLLFELLRQTKSPWLQAAMPIVLNYLVQNLQLSIDAVDAEWLAFEMQCITLSPVIVNALEQDESLNDAFYSLLTFVTDSADDSLAVTKPQPPATTEHPNRFFVVAERTEEAQSVSSKHDAASQPMP